MTVLESRLRATGHKNLMPYVTGGVTAGWTDYLKAYADAGADVIEVGLPFSDPTVDGATIQRASDVALARGATPRRLLDDLARADVGVPVVVSTYSNLALRSPDFCASLHAAGVAGLIVPDLPVEEAGELARAAAAAGVDLALLASPATPTPRLRAIAAASRGFVYAISLMGTTGERSTLAASAAALATRLRHATDRLVFLGFGISTPAHAAEAARGADGVIVGAALMRQILDGAGAARVGAFVGTLRAALDRSGLHGLDGAVPGDRR